MLTDFSFPFQSRKSISGTLEPIDPTVGEVIRNNSGTVDRDMVAYQATMSSTRECPGFIS